MKLRLSLFATHGPMLVHRTLHETEAFTLCTHGPFWSAHTVVPVVRKRRQVGIRSVIMGIPQFHMDIINSMILKSFTFFTNLSLTIRDF